MSWEDEDPEGFHAPLPPEDRLWRHPSEVAAAQRDQTLVAVPIATTTTFRTSWRQGAALALLGAATGALVVTGLFLSIRTPAAATRPVTQAFALDPVVPVPVRVDAADWAATVTDRASEGVVTVSVTRDAIVSVGSAVAYVSNGMLLTSARLVDKADGVMVTTADAQRHVGTVVGVDEVSGLAVLHIDVDDQPIVQLDIWSKPAVGDYTVALSGSSSSTDVKMSTVTELDVKVHRDDADSLYGMIELGGHLPQGGDGGALVDNRGAVVGIVLDTGAANTTYAVPIVFARKIAGDIAESGTGRHPWIGITGKSLTIAEQLDLGLLGGVKLTSVIGAPAEDAGLQRGDVITSLGGEPIESFTDLILQLRRHIPGKVLGVDFERDGESHHTEVELQLRQPGPST